VGNLNTGTGNVSVAFPGGFTYTPGVTQRMVVTVTDPRMRRGGFQLTARSGATNRTQAGTFTPTDGFTQLACASTGLTTQTIPAVACAVSQPLQYIEHTLPGARTVSGSITFEFDWTPPATDVGNITIYVAGNAANGDRNNTGDFIYTTSFTLTATAAGGGGPNPIISSGEVRNGAGFQNSIAAGSWVQIKGANLSNTDPGRTWKDSEVVGGNLPASLDGTSVTINGKPAFVYYVSPAQVNVVAPVDTAEGPVDVVVTNNGQSSAAGTVNLARFSPAFFEYNGSNAIATRNPDYALIGSVAGTVPARPGDVLIFWGTGFGPTNPAIPNGKVIAGAPAATTNPTVTIGGVNAQLAAVVMSPGAAGLYQVAVTVPDVGDGDQEVIATVSGVSSPAGVTIFVKR
jgi:uncharacterized protein (TIGR03437 family)